MSLALVMSEFDFFLRGTTIATKPSHEKVIGCAKPAISCAAPVEIPYYGAQLGPVDFCAFCGGEKADPKTDRKKNCIAHMCKV